MKKSAIIILVISVIAVIFYGMRYLKTSDETVIATSITKEDVLHEEGMIVYSENVYKAPNDGTFYSFTEEGARVGKNRSIAKCYDGVVGKDVLHNLKNIEKKIVDLGNGPTSKMHADETSVQAVIDGFKADIVEAVNEGDVSKIAELKKSIKVVAGLEEGEDVSDDLEMLIQEKAEIEAGIGKNHQNIYSDMSGIYTSLIDGLEDVIKPEDLKSYNVQKYKELKAPQESMIGSRTVENGEVVCKVVDNHEWFLAAVIPKESRERLNVGDKIGIRISELPGKVCEATVDYISEETEGSGEYFISIRCEQYLEGVFNIRKCKFDMILSSYFGYEVPVYAIRVRDGKNGVLVQGSGVEIFKECEILKRDDKRGMVMIAPSGEGSVLKNGDRIILTKEK